MEILDLFMDPDYNETIFHYITMIQWISSIKFYCCNIYWISYVSGKTEV